MCDCCLPVCDGRCDAGPCVMLPSRFRGRGIVIYFTMDLPYFTQTYLTLRNLIHRIRTTLPIEVGCVPSSHGE